MHIRRNNMKAEIGVMLLQTKKTLKTASRPSELGERHGAGSPSQPTEGTNPADTMISDVSLQNWEGTNSCCSKAPRLWYFVKGP